MNRPVLSCTHCAHRGVQVGSEHYAEQVSDWTRKILNKEVVIKPGFVFEWSRSPASVRNTALLFDAVMCNVQLAQWHLQNASCSAGRAAYTHAISAAKVYAYVMHEIMPKWTFQPVASLPDCLHSDIYGHYCLSRAVAYNAIGKADLPCTDAAQSAACSNAAHLYAQAATLIGGNTHSMINMAQYNIATMLKTQGNMYLQKWDNDDDEEGAAKALACFEEANRRYMDAGVPGCEERVQFAYDRNQVHWLTPKLPDFKKLWKVRISPLPTPTQSQ